VEIEAVAADLEMAIVKMGKTLRTVTFHDAVAVLMPYSSDDSFMELLHVFSRKLSIETRLQVVEAYMRRAYRYIRTHAPMKLSKSREKKPTVSADGEGTLRAGPSTSVLADREIRLFQRDRENIERNLGQGYRAREHHLNQAFTQNEQPLQRQMNETLGEQEHERFLTPGERYNVHNAWQIERLTRRQLRLEKTGRVMAFVNERMPLAGLMSHRELKTLKNMHVVQFEERNSADYTIQEFIDSLEIWTGEMSERTRLLKLRENVDRDTLRFIDALEPRIRFNYEPLVDALITRYQPVLTVNKLFEDYDRLRQRADETVVEFMSRYEQLLSKMRELIGDFQPPLGRVKKVDFLRRTRKELEDFVKRDTPSATSDASRNFDDLVQLLQIAECEHPPQHPAEEGEHVSQSGELQRLVKEILSEEIPCIHCQMNDHSASECDELRDELRTLLEARNSVKEEQDETESETSEEADSEISENSDEESDVVEEGVSDASDDAEQAMGELCINDQRH